MRKEYINKIAAIGCISLLVGISGGCMNQNEVYDPNHRKDQLPAMDTYFGFKTTSEVKLNVNYDLPGCKALLEVYTENPIDGSTAELKKKADVEPIFKAYTDEDGKYNGIMTVPAMFDKIFLYTDAAGVPRCLELGIENGIASFDGTINRETEPETRAYQFRGKAPYTLNAGKSLYSLCKWKTYGQLYYNYTKTVTNVNSEKIGSLADRIDKNLESSCKNNNGSNAHLLANAEKTNIYISPKTAAGKDVESATIDFIFLEQSGAYRNSFGYYYYKGTTPPTDMSQVKKYIIFPNVAKTDHLAPWMKQITSKTILKSGDKVRLKYFGEDGNQSASEQFPAGYTIGWFMVSDGFNGRYYDEYNSDKWRHNDQRDTNNYEINANRPILSSNDEEQQFITVYDKKSGKLIIGVEDGGDTNYKDLLFYVEANPMEAIVNPENPGRPSIDEGGEVEVPDVTENKTGTLAFEDIWPKGGDYDMNDVVVEYNRAVTFDKDNMVKKIVDTFRAIHCGAQITDAFAYQVGAGQLGSVSGDGIIETATNSIIVFENCKEAVGKEYVITREFSTPFDKADLKDYNPFIISNYVAGATSRTEIHLPKRESTSYADKSENYTQDDAYFIKKDGKYPFAVELPILGFKVADEMKRIDDDTQYPLFRTWAESKGTKATDWYIHKKK